MLPWLLQSSSTISSTSISRSGGGANIDRGCSPCTDGAISVSGSGRGDGVVGSSALNGFGQRIVAAEQSSAPTSAQGSPSLEEDDCYKRVAGSSRTGGCKSESSFQWRPATAQHTSPVPPTQTGGAGSGQSCQDPWLPCIRRSLARNPGVSFMLMLARDWRITAPLST